MPRPSSDAFFARLRREAKIGQSVARDPFAYQRSAPPSIRPVEDPEEAARWFAFSLRSLARSHEMIAATLTIPCADHAAASGAFCWRGAKGLCMPRFERGRLLRYTTETPGWAQ
jgi:hypothetical protein